jgi:hypothetical protein
VTCGVRVNGAAPSLWRKLPGSELDGAAFHRRPVVVTNVEVNLLGIPGIRPGRGVVIVDALHRDHRKAAVVAGDDHAIAVGLHRPREGQDLRPEGGEHLRVWAVDDHSHQHTQPAGWCVRTLRRGVQAERMADRVVIAVDDLLRLDAAVAGIAPGSLDCYVQLPGHVAARGDAVVERVRNFLEDGLLARFGAASTILRKLSDKGRVVLVGGNTPVEASAPDDQSARRALMDVLAHAIQAEKSPARIGVRVLPHDESAERIAAVALGGEPTRAQALAELRAREPEISFPDWRIEVMGLVNGEF